MRGTPREAVEIVGRELLIGLRSVAQRAVASGVSSVAEDVRGVFEDGSSRLGRFIAGCEAIASQGRETDPPPPPRPPPPPAPNDTSPQTPDSKKRKKPKRR